MGHVRLGSLPKTRKWQQVIDLLGGDADVGEIAAASSDAAENSLARAANDPAFLHSFWLLTQIPLAARTENFAAELRQLGLNVGSAPSLMEVLSAFGDAVDRHAHDAGAGQRTDFGEMARMAATEALGTVAGRDLPGHISDGRFGGSLSGWFVALSRSREGLFGRPNPRAGPFG